MSEAKEIWETLSAINVNENTDKKGDLTYLSWAWAWGRFMDTYPEAAYAFQDNEVHQDGSMTVHCEVTVDGLVRTMWLAVMDFRNKAIQNPNSVDINNAKMRCLTKCISMFGLGHYIYAGEDLPDKASEVVNNKPNYDSFDSDKTQMKIMIDGAEKTTAQIISHLKTKYTLSPEQAQQIINLGNGTDETPPH